MKNIFKKNQIIITALAIMIVIAGYLQFVDSKNDDALDVSTQDTLDYDTYNETADDDVTDSDLVTIEDADLNKDEVASTEGTDETADVAAEDEDALDEVADISDEDLQEVLEVTDKGEVVVEDNKGEETSTPGEAILVNTTINSNFFASSRLSREQTRALNKERFLEVINNTNISEELKVDAINGLLDLTKAAETEDETETYLEAKGFPDTIVQISDKNVVVIVNAETISEQDVAKIEDAVKIKTGVTSSEIFIQPVVMND